MAIDPGLAEILQETWQPLGALRIKRMFGGAGVFIGDTMIALIADDALYVKGDRDTQAAYEAAGSSPFTYTRSGAEPVIMSYWRAPDRLLDDPDELRAWGERALAAAERAARKKKPRARRS
jgi:DNA transformation protein